MAPRAVAVTSPTCLLPRASTNATTWDRLWGSHFSLPGRIKLSQNKAFAFARSHAQKHSQSENNTRRSTRWRYLASDDNGHDIGLLSPAALHAASGLLTDGHERKKVSLGAEGRSVSGPKPTAGGNQPRGSHEPCTFHTRLSTSLCAGAMSLSLRTCCHVGNASTMGHL